MDIDYGFEATINESGLLDELKKALAEFWSLYGSAAPGMDRITRHRMKYYLRELWRETTDPQVESHFWMVTLDLLKKAANKLSDGQGAALVTAIDRLVPLMEQHLGHYRDVTLREITADSMSGVCRLTDTLQEPQSLAVAPNVRSLAEALFSQYAWYRAIYAGKAAVGFLMLYDNPEEKEYFLWRFMIAEPYQKRGYAAQAIQRLIEHVRTRPGATELGLSCIEGEGSPEGFYAKQGFVRTGKKEDDEIYMKVDL